MELPDATKFSQEVEDFAARFRRSPSEFYAAISAMSTVMDGVDIEAHSTDDNFEIALEPDSVAEVKG